MKLIVITTPQFFEGEAEAIASLFRAGLEILHLRKPGASAEELTGLLRRLPAEYLPRIVTHEHFALASVFPLKGIHLNRRNPHAPARYTGHISCSCHYLSEVMERKPSCDYVFLSPIYNSISKEGYPSAYSRESLQQAQQAGIIDSRVIALGGINEEHLPQIASLGFGGAALLGDIWQRKEPDFTRHFLQLRALVSSL
ncbi:thiamine phosphate synthase [Bacteroides sp.]|uniref:thiamine phosphate synthase n=1 Tax=Bacteroides sp. TaxID=29523 RepID=UPI003AB2AC30